MDAADKRMLEREALRNMIQQWNDNRLDLFELSEPNENLEFHGVMRFYFQDSGQKIATKCIRVASDATVSDVIETLIEKFRPDMRMLSLGSYSLWETHGPDDERRLEPHEKPLLVQLNWHADDREGRFLLKCTTGAEQTTLPPVTEKGDQNFKRKLSKREKKDLKKKEKLSRLKSDSNNENRPVAEKLYKELPETSFTRSISNPEAVMRRRRQLKLERKLQQFRSKDGGPDTGGTLKIYGSSLCPDVPYKTLLLSIGDTAAGIVREMLDKYGLSRQDPLQYCLVQVDGADNSEYVLEDDECPLAIVMTHHHRGSIMFHVRRRPADSQPRRRKKKAGASSGGSGRPGNEPVLVEVAPDGTLLENGRRIRVTEPIDVGSGNGTALQLYGPSIQPRHCVVAPADGGGYTVTPLHPDAQLCVNGQRVMHSQRLQHGCTLKFGRVSTFRFMDPTQETLINRNLSQSQHFGSGSIYDRSPTSGGGGSGGGRDDASGALSPASLASHHHDLDSTNLNTNDAEYTGTMSPVSHHDTYGYNQHDTPYNNNNTLKLDNESLMMSQHLDTKDDYIRDEHTGSLYNDQDQSSTANRTANTQYKDNYETTFDLDGNVETKSICSAKSGGSGQDNRMNATVPASRPGAEAILPAVLEFPEAGQAQFLAAVISRLDPHAPAFKLAPVYTLYLCARYRASTHYRPELTPTERAHKLTAFLHHVATLIHATVQERCTESAAQAFWMANASELLHFLKCDRHISSFSTQAQDLLPTTVQNAFSNLVSCFQEELSPALVTLNKPQLVDATEATAPTLQALAAAMVLLRRCRVNAALTIQLFSHLFHYINAVCFNKLVTEPGLAEARWGAALSARLVLLGAWAERQGLELAADCHLARSHQAARLIQGEYRTADACRAALAACFKLNSVQVRALLSAVTSPDVLEAAVQHARAQADELYRADGREITLEESEWLGVGLLIPGDGFSAEVVRGVPPGLADFVAPLQRGGLCRLAHQPHAVGVWTVYMTGYGAPHQRRPPEPRVHIIQLNKNSNGMGLSIVAAKGAGQSKLGIYIKSVVPGGAAAADGRLAAGDQLLSVDGHSLVGITQEKAAEYLVRTGPTVTLEVAKQGAVLHGLATLLHQPAYNQRQDEGVVYEDRLKRNSGTFTNTIPALLRPFPPLSELATAGNRRRSTCNGRCKLLRDGSSESSSDGSEEYQPQRRPQYHGSIPRLIITLDQENNQLREDLSPETPGYPLELKCGPPPRPIPIFTFTCEDFDEQQLAHSDNVPSEEPPAVPDPPANYELSSESGDLIDLPPTMRPIDTRLTLDLFNMRARENELYRQRCIGVEECVSACECCRTPQPDDLRIPYIDEPNSEPIIVETDHVHTMVSTPKIRRIFPSLSLDKADEAKPETADATCQTPSSPIHNEVDSNVISAPEPIGRKLDLNLDVKADSKKVEQIHCRLKRALFNISKSYSSQSEETDVPSTYSTSGSLDAATNYERVSLPKRAIDVRAKQVLDSVDRKSWKSPDEYRPSVGKVKALAKHFNSINLRYCVKNYKRNCQSSPNLSTRDDKTVKIKENLQSSISLADIQYETTKTDTIDTKADKMSDDEVKSILIQLEDWSKFGSRGSEDTLAQGNEFEIPNLPSEDHTETNGSFVFNEILDKKPKKITLENIRLKSNQSSVNTDSTRPSKESVVKTESIDLSKHDKIPRIVAMIPNKHAISLLDVSTVKKLRESRRESGTSVAQSCPDITCDSQVPKLGTGGQTPWSSVGGAVRRASERDLPSRLAAESVKPSKSTPALHHVASPPPSAAQAHLPHSSSGTIGSQAAPGSPGGASWSHKSRSSHNLSTQAQQDAFYQNLQNMHSVTQQHGQLGPDRWSSLRSSTNSNRPQSAHFSANNIDPPPDSPLLHHQQNHASAMSVRAAKLAEMSEEVTRRQQHQQQQLQQQYQQQQQQQKQPLLPHQHIQPHPNIMSPPHLTNQQHMHPQHQLPNHVHSQLHMQQSPGQNHVAQTQNHIAQAQNHMGSQQLHHPPLSPSASTHSSAQQMYQNQHAQPQRYEWHQPGPPSPQRSQPPVAPKPQSVRRTDMEQDEQQLSQQQQHQHQQQQQQQQQQQLQQQHQQQLNQQQLQQQHQQQLNQQQQQLQQQHQQQLNQQQQQLQHQHQQQQQQQLNTTVQPDDEWYVASALEPPAVSVYPVGGAGGGAAGARGAPHNPWQREEREREAEARRMHARARRDATINHLLQLGASRSPVQNQQLRALQLERDFERRATQHDQDEGGDSMQVSSDPPRSPSPPAAPAHPAPHPAPHPAESEPRPQPKGILKSNRTETTNGYATDSSRGEDFRMSSVNQSISTLSLASPPPPPERGSSFAVMAARALSPAPAPPALTPAAAPPPPAPQVITTTPTHAHASVLSGASSGAVRDKRVSFHERVVPPPASPSPAPPPAPPCDPPPLDDEPHQQHHQHAPREDPDRFLEEAEMLMGGPTSPTSPGAPAHAHQHTPGVIGAQEVYRDPRARRLAEKQAREPAAPIPEQLSFKEKMKMFALESGEASTPKDKVKISRAQRDIDAVH